MKLYLKIGYNLLAGCTFGLEWTTKTDHRVMLGVFISVLIDLLPID